MRRSIVQIGAAAAGIALALTGCSSNDTGGQASPVSSAPKSSASSSAGPSSGSGSVSSQSISWMNQLCGEMVDLAGLNDIDMPDVKKGDIEGAQKALSDVIATLEKSLSSLVHGLKDLPPAPIPEGDQAKQDLLEAFEPAEAKATKIKDKLADAEPGDKQAVADATKGLQSIGSSMQKMDNPLQKLKGTELVPAAKQAPKCQKLGSVGDSSDSGGSSDSGVPSPSSGSGGFGN